MNDGYFKYALILNDNDFFHSDVEGERFNIVMEHMFNLFKHNIIAQIFDSGSLYVEYGITCNLCKLNTWLFIDKSMDESFNNIGDIENISYEHMLTLTCEETIIKNILE